jgi:hypothetical protein
MLGLIVDEVNDVFSLAANQLIEPDALLPDGIECPAILKGAAYLEEKAVIIIDPSQLLDPTQLAALDRAIKALLADGEATENDGSAAASLPHSKQRSRRRNMDSNLADQIANLASDLPPVDGQQPSNPADPAESNPV